MSPRPSRGGRPNVASRLWRVGGELLARDTMVLTNAIAFNFLLCLFPLLLVLVAVSQQLPGRRVSTALLLVLNELIPFEREAMAFSLQGLRKVARGLEVMSVILIIWGSSGIFMPVELALSRVWGGQARGFWRSRMLAILMTVAGGLLAFARALGEFGAVVIVSGNIIGKTLTAPVLITQLINGGKPEDAAAVATLLFGLSFVLVLVTERLLATGRKETA